MPTFSEALDRFKQDGFFGLDTELYTEQIEKLKLCAKFLKIDKPEILPYQFHLSNVQFIRGYLPRPERIMAGAITEHAQRNWNSRVPDVALFQMARLTNEPNTNLRFNDPNSDSSERLLECVLWDLLSQSDTWSSIKIDWVFFLRYGAPHYLCANFHTSLLNSLAEPTGTSLEELSLKPFSLSNSLTALVNFLSRNVHLKILHLEISDASAKDWLELSQALSVHPNLECVNFGNTQFNEGTYSVLSKLLDENYRIKEINIAAPIDNWVLIDAYNQLNQRLSKPCQVRFKEERLSQARLLEVAFQTLVEREKVQLEHPDRMVDDGEEKKQALLMRRINFLLSNQGTLAITDTEKVTWLKDSYVLPEVYPNHKEYMKEFSSLVQLHLGELVLGGTNTVGYLLLERGLEIRDTQIIQRLLESKADLFESPPEGIEKPFLVRLFEMEGPWQEVVIHHLKKDLNVLVPAVRMLSPYEKLKSICDSLTLHLNAYFKILEKRKKQPKLLHLLNGVMSNFQDRQEECAQSFHNLALYIKVATDDAAGKKVTYDSLFEAQEILEQLLEDSSKANRGFLGRSKLHDDLLLLGKELNKQLKFHQRELYYREKNKSINYFTDDREKDNENLEKMKADLAKEREAREKERQRHAQEQKEMKETIEELKRLMQAQNRTQNQTSKEATSSQEQERPGDSAYFFGRR